MSLAIFDLDDTLTFCDTETLWLNFLIKHKYLNKESTDKAQEKFIQDYQEGQLNFHDVISLSLSPILSKTLKEQQRLQRQFKKEVLQFYILPKAVKIINSHRLRGDDILIISAGNEFLVEPAVSFFRHTDFICTRVKRDPLTGSYLPLLEGNPVYQKEKVSRWQQWLKKNNKTYDKTLFYSDSINDLPLLELVDIPIAVNPCAKLEQIALKKGWSIFDMKQNFFVDEKKIFSN
jgi:HAD superfamily hydrolase (TIGR01490 family)